MKLITRDTDYALRAVCFIAKEKQDVVSVTRLVKMLKVPRPFLRKILQVLSQKGILRSFKGQGGGFSLAKKPSEIYLTELISIFQGKFSINDCFLSKALCPNIKVCPLRRKITKIEDYALKELGVVTIASLLR